MTVIVDSGATAPEDRPTARPTGRGPRSGFDVHTVRCDATRANLHVSGRLGTDGARVLAEVIAGHTRAGRRFLRLHVGDLRSLGAEAVEVIAQAHEQLLSRRGTMIITGVSPRIEATLRSATPATPLFMLAPTAAERLD